MRILGKIRDVQVIARGKNVRIRHLLRQRYGRGKWRKMKGVARVELPDGYIGDAELQWYEAHGIGRVMFKVKRRLE